MSRLRFCTCIHLIIIGHCGFRCIELCCRRNAEEPSVQAAKESSAEAAVVYTRGLRHLWTDERHLKIQGASLFSPAWRAWCARFAQPCVHICKTCMTRAFDTTLPAHQTSMYPTTTSSDVAFSVVGRHVSRLPQILPRSIYDQCSDQY